MTMVERVARAIYAADLGDWGEPMPKSVRETYRCRARAALEAMLEPTKTMVYAAMTTPYPTVAEAGGMIPQAKQATRLEWNAMIEAALTETEAGSAL
jgi:hypothetical protein